MVGSSASEFLAKKGVGRFDAALQEEYNNLSSDQKKELANEAKNRPRDMKKIIKDLDKHKSCSYVLVRLHHDTKCEVVSLSKNLAAKSSDFEAPVGEIIGMIKKNVKEVTGSSSTAKESLTSVEDMRKETLACANRAFKEAGCDGAIPWKCIKSDIENGTQVAPGYFQSSLQCPYDMRKVDFQELFDKLKTTPLQFVRTNIPATSSGPSAKRRRQTLAYMPQQTQQSKLGTQRPLDQVHIGIEPCVITKPRELSLFSVQPTINMQQPMPNQPVQSDDYHMNDLLNKMYGPNNASQSNSPSKIPPLKDRVPGAAKCFGSDETV